MVSTTSHRITYTILSMSLLTVMAGAAVAPALATMFEHFSDCPKVLVQLIVSIPAFFIILTNLLFLEISRHFGSRTIVLAGLVLYVASGVCCFFATGIGVLLVMRALLGVSVGLVMPLSTGLLAYYYPPEQQARLMGLSAAMNQIGGVTATLLAGILCTVGWNYSFLVYSLGLIAVVLVALFLPDERLDSSNKRGVPFVPKQLLKFHPSVVGMVLLMTIFFVFVTNFAITASHDGKFSAVEITLIMVGTDVVATFVGLFFGKMMRHIPHVMKYRPCVLHYGVFTVLRERFHCFCACRFGLHRNGKRRRHTLSQHDSFNKGRSQFRHNRHAASFRRFIFGAVCLSVAGVACGKTVGRQRV